MLSKQSWNEDSFHSELHEGDNNHWSSGMIYHFHANIDWGKLVCIVKDFSASHMSNMTQLFLIHKKMTNH